MLILPLSQNLKGKGHKRNKLQILKRNNKKINPPMLKIRVVSFVEILITVRSNATIYHAWRAKKGMLLSLFCSDDNLVLVPRHAW